MASLVALFSTFSDINAALLSSLPLLVKVRNVIVESTSLEEKLLATGLSTSASAFEGVFFSSHFPELISVESLFASLDDVTLVRKEKDEKVTVRR